MSINLVKSFNALPRQEKIGTISNEWHFDVRYIALEPTPSHILSLIQPKSCFLHTERLPIGLPNDASGITFFPETAEEAAPEVAKALLHAFVNGMGMNKMIGSQAPSSCAPWKLTTEDKDLADAVGKELRRLGVLPIGLCNIKVSSKMVNTIMLKSFDEFFKVLKRNAGYEGYISTIIITPDSIQFEKPKSKRVVATNSDAPVTSHVLLKYVQELSGACPPMVEDYMDSTSLSSALPGQIQSIEERLSQKPDSVIKAEADRGDQQAAFDYGLRLYVGLGCPVNRKSSRDYLVKALTSPSASDTLKATCHGVLINWNVISHETQTIKMRYLLAGAHHVNHAAALCRRVSPRGVQSSPNVLYFMFHVYERFSANCPQLSVICKDGIRALDDRKKEMQKGQEKMHQKRLENPNRYRCAAVGCGIESDTGKLLSQCAGKCDPDKKPSYCSKTCQKADWKNHKPYCVPGAECSVIDDGAYSADAPIPSSTPSSKTAAGAMQVPVRLPDGSTVMVSSSTMGADFLKDLKGHSEKYVAEKGSTV